MNTERKPRTHLTVAQQMTVGNWLTNNPQVAAAKDGDQIATILNTQHPEANFTCQQIKRIAKALDVKLLDRRGRHSKGRVKGDVLQEKVVSLAKAIREPSSASPKSKQRGRDGNGMALPPVNAQRRSQVRRTITIQKDQGNE